MNMITRVTVEALTPPVCGYAFSVKILTSIDSGRTFYYSGNGKYFQTEEEAEEYKFSLERSNTK